MTGLGRLKEFRAERTENNVLHLVFDMPGRPMNVFSNAAIAELGIFSEWLRGSDVKGVVIRSGKPSAFCAGADLGELGLAYDMIIAAPAEARDRVALLSNRGRQDRSRDPLLHLGVVVFGRFGTFDSVDVDLVSLFIQLCSHQFKLG